VQLTRLILPRTLDPQLVIRALCQLGHVRRLENLGMRGPLDASAGRASDFGCLFGRDSLRMALDLLDDFPAVARVTIRRLTALQGMGENTRAEEEPGRILHEYRCASDPRAPHLARYWDLPYYGSVDATPLYIVAMGAFCDRYGPSLLNERVRDQSGRMVRLRTGLERALGWIERRLQRDGYICVQRAQPHGIQNQVWEDSGDSHYDETGRLFDPAVPYAPVAVQGLAYDALLIGAACTDDRRRARRLRAQARLLRRKVLTEFWIEDMATFAPAVVCDASPPRPARVAASSPGHLLATGLLDGSDAAAYREALVERLLAPDLLATAGIRTKSTAAPRFHPGAYHNGSVWPMDTGVIADGLRRHGYVAEADDLEDRILRACATVGELVEFFRGDLDDRVLINECVVDVMDDGRIRKLEQPPQHTQGWTATRVWRILRRRARSGMLDDQEVSALETRAA
jgi:glycogen debranching enzyme